MQLVLFHEERRTPVWAATRPVYFRWSQSASSRVRQTHAGECTASVPNSANAHCRLLQIRRNTKGAMRTHNVYVKSRNPTFSRTRWNSVSQGPGIKLALKSLYNPRIGWQSRLMKLLSIVIKPTSFDECYRRFLIHVSCSFPHKMCVKDKLNQPRQILLRSLRAAFCAMRN